MNAVVRRRHFANLVSRTLILAATLLVLAFLVWICGVLLYEGFSAFKPTLFTEMTPPPGESGGLANAIVGSLMLVGVAMFVATPIGLLAGTYLNEYGKGTWLASVVRFVNDVLLAKPSILAGLFVYEIIVAPMGSFSGWAGSAALAIIAIPVVVRTTEDMMNLVPNSMREAAYALGASRSRVILSVSYRAARVGITTGVILAVARISGETAPLLFTSLNNQFWSTDMSHSIANLPVMIFQFAMNPYPDWQALAWAGALLITLTILALSIISRVFLRSANSQH
ncbi:Phosphate transport system permease protein PstA [Marinomonas spartinae]|uniref:Phosphate transport system permease protein PstA n=1 Tax=Marinomonas spartinae TaxID=1792290 RepID=A0A1A8TMB8_9GAMM|nr:phosphate ABC transporter permease PstA [Marinomonas spartinae]SBS35146.1 Phosphate transport system permease protein PstA [Marinomonas spartinae]SBS38373.1 Phosphate transport system permease protein PstA [Marinomonas spartinae]